MDNERIIYLYTRIKSKEATAAEEQEFDLLLSDTANQEILKSFWDETWNTAFADDMDKIRIKNEERILADILLNKPEQTSTIKLWPRIAGIAAAVIGIAVCVYLYRPADAPLSSRPESLVSRDLNDIAPGGYGAKITYTSGKTINLSTDKNGVVMRGDDLRYNDNTPVIQSDPLSSRANAKDLDPSGVGMTKERTGITISTEKGQTYSFTSADGTKVWLNSDSKLEFLPNSGNNAQRIVKLSGEVDFEVAKVTGPNGVRVPFFVEAKGQRIEVLGTHFNVNAYDDEPNIRTTLLEGSVRLSPLLSSGATSLSSRATSLSSRGKRSDEGPVTLKPGQQATNTGTTITVTQVDVNEAIAWREGLFTYHKTPLAELMRQVSRWYNVEVEYENPALKNKLFSGSVSRYDKVSGILGRIEFTGTVKFEIKGNKIIVK